MAVILPHFRRAVPCRAWADLRARITRHADKRAGSLLRRANLADESEVREAAAGGAV